MFRTTFSREEAERLAAEERERAKRERRCPECGNKVFLFFLILILSVGTRFSLFSLEYFEMRSVEASFSFEVYQCAAKKFRN